nr:hypothetical protein [Methanobrevibacter sp.]
KDNILLLTTEPSIVASVVRSNILSLFVKENQNQLDYNVWSAGEYKNSLEDITYIPPEDIVKTTTEYSVIGENSIHLKSTVNETKNFIITIKQFSANTTLTAKAHFRVINGDCYFRLMNSSSEIFANVLVHKGTCGEITINGVNSVTGNVRLMVTTSSDNVKLYLDNISLITN